MMNTALVIVDIQNDYFPGGNRELARPLEAAEQAGRLLNYFRQAGMPVANVQHVATKPGATTFLPGTRGVEIHASVAPAPGETVIEKHYPNSFRETGLLAFLKERGIERLVICGMQTNMCIDATTRAATDLGFTCLVAGDACAARDLSYAGETVPAAQVHTTFLAALNGSYGKVMKTDEVIRELTPVPSL
jgi:nicotinamidase-related amidase